MQVQPARSHLFGAPHEQRQNPALEGPLEATYPQPPHGDPARHGSVISFSRRSGGVSPGYTCFLLFMCDNEIMNHDLAICRRQIAFGCIGLRVDAGLEIISRASTRITHL